MNKLEQLQASINKIPREYKHVKNLALAMLGNADLLALRAYINGAYDMAECLTGDESLLNPLREVREILR